MEMTIVVDVAIGLTFIYLGASLFVTILNEYIAQVLEMRGKQLARNLKMLIDDPATIEKLCKSAAIAPFFISDRKSKLSSYVDPTVLAQMLVGTVRAGAQGVATMQQIIESLDKLAESSMKQQLKTISQTAKDDVDAFVHGVAAWVDGSLTMLGEGYKRRQQWISFGVGLLVAVVFNLDTVAVVDRLYRDQDAREVTSGAAAEFMRTTDQSIFAACSAQSSQERGKDPKCIQIAGLIDGVNLRNDTFGKLPIGWAQPAEAMPPHFPIFFTRPLGWLLTALAISLGASFWFDLLGKLVSIRHGMRRPEVTPEK